MAQGRWILCHSIRAHRQGGVYGVPRGGGPGQVQGRVRHHPSGSGPHPSDDRSEESLRDSAQEQIAFVAWLHDSGIPYRI